MALKHKPVIPTDSYQRKWNISYFHFFTLMPMQNAALSWVPPLKTQCLQNSATKASKHYAPSAYPDSVKLKKIYQEAYLKKSSVQYNWLFLAKHFPDSIARHSTQRKQPACHVRSDTFSTYRSTIISWHPPHLGILAVTNKYYKFYGNNILLKSQRSLLK